jgi:hypothetical protein
MLAKMLVRGRGTFIDWHEYDVQGKRSKAQAKGRAQEKRHFRRAERRLFERELTRGLYD